MDTSSTQAKMLQAADEESFAAEQSLAQILNELKATPELALLISSTDESFGQYLTSMESLICELFSGGSMAEMERILMRARLLRQRTDTLSSIAKDLAL